MKILFASIMITSMLLSCNSGEKNAKVAVEKHLKETLRDPNSLEIYSSKVEKEKEHVYIVTVDYGAKNGFGGMDRTTEKFTVIGNEVMKNYFK